MQVFFKLVSITPTWIFNVGLYYFNSKIQDYDIFILKSLSSPTSPTFITQASLAKKLFQA